MSQVRRRVAVVFGVVGLVVVFWLGNQVWARGRAGVVAGQPFAALTAGVGAVTSPRLVLSLDFGDVVAGLVAVTIAGCGVVYYRLSQPQRGGQEHGSARWGRPRDIKPLTHRVVERNLWLTRGVRLSLDRVAKPEHQRNLNVLVIGGSGTGKSRNFVMPNLVRGLSSGVVTDPKGELLAMSGAALKEAGFKIRVLNLVDFAQSDCFNPFRYLRPGHEPEDVARMVRAIITNTTNPARQGGDRFWDDAESGLLNALIAFVAATYAPEEQHLGSVMDLLGQMEATPTGEASSQVDQLFTAASQVGDIELIKYAQAQHRVFTQAAQKTAASILVTTGTRLAPLHIPAVRRLLERDTLHLDLVGQEKTMLFLVISDADKQFAWLASMVFTMFFQRSVWLADKEPSRHLPIPVHCWMDEFANIGKIPDFEVLAATLRSRGISFSAIVQNLGQGKALYDQTGWQTIMGNCDSTLFLGSSDAETRKWISEALGKQAFRTVDYSTNRGRGGASRQHRTIARDLLSADEVGRLPGREALVLVRGLPPFRDRKLAPAPEREPYRHERIEPCQNLSHQI